MKHLLIVSRSSDPRGGADRIIEDLCRQLPEHDWKVTLGLVRGSRFNLPQKYLEIHPGLPVIEIDGSLGTRRARLHAIRKAVTAHRPDAVLSMRVFDAYEVVARIKNDGGTYQPRLFTGVRSFEERYLSDVRRYRNVIDGCFTSGRLIARACIDWCGMDERRVVSIAGGVAAADEIPVHEAAYSPVRLLYAGRLEQTQKRALDIIPFVEELTRRGISFQLKVAGEGSQRKILEEKLRPWTARNEVQFLGWVDRNRLYNDVYRSADILVHFAAWEGVTISPREAMAHGIVPVISRFTGLFSEGQFLDGKNAMTFPVGDTRAAADCVMRLINDPRVFARMSTAAVLSQRGEYSDKGAVEKWDRTLRALMSLPPMTGNIPHIREALTGRMSRLGIPDAWQVRVRSFLNVPVRHASAGSEWPTSSGMMSAAESNELMAFARREEEVAASTGVTRAES